MAYPGLNKSMYEYVNIGLENSIKEQKRYEVLLLINIFL